MKFVRQGFEKLEHSQTDRNSHTRPNTLPRRVSGWSYVSVCAYPNDKFMLWLTSIVWRVHNLTIIDEASVAINRREMAAI